MLYTHASLTAVRQPLSCCCDIPDLIDLQSAAMKMSCVMLKDKVLRMASCMPALSIRCGLCFSYGMLSSLPEAANSGRCWAEAETPGYSGSQIQKSFHCLVWCSQMRSQTEKHS